MDKYILVVLFDRLPYMLTFFPFLDPIKGLMDLLYLPGKVNDSTLCVTLFIHIILLWM